jgi:hypothetical protein
MYAVDNAWGLNKRRTATLLTAGYLKRLFWGSVDGATRTARAL